MHILTENNIPFSMNNVSSTADDIRYSILDYSNTDNIDYFCIPLVFLETFSTPAAELRIGQKIIQVPLDWSIVIGEKDVGDLEVVPITQCMDRDFSVFCFNPINGYRAEYHTLDVTNIYPDVKWHVPKLKYGHLLVLPIEMKLSPLCCFIVKDTHKIPDVLDISKML